MLKKIITWFKEPDFTIVGEHGPYLHRWYITPYSGWCRGVKSTDRWYRRAANKMIRALPNIYLHKFVHDDPDRAEHDHPWCSLSVILTSGYREIINGITHYRYARGIHGRKASASHRVVLWRDSGIILPAWTLFFTGPKVRDWGFHCPKGWIPWWKFTKPGKPGEIGAGCGEYE